MLRAAALVSSRAAAAARFAAFAVSCRTASLILHPLALLPLSPCDGGEPCVFWQLAKYHSGSGGSKRYMESDPDDSEAEDTDEAKCTHDEDSEDFDDSWDDDDESQESD